MKKIIDGKVYNTETATCVGEWSNGYYCDDFHYEATSLYQKKNGEFFLYGEGNAMSSYAQRCGNNNWCGGSTISPMSPNEAYEWAMKYLSATEFEKIFEPVTEDDENHLLTINLSHNVFQQLVSIASSNKKAISDIITDFVTNSCDTVQAESAKINK